MQHIQNHIKRIIDGAEPLRHHSPELAGVLADLRAIVRDRDAQRTLALFVIQLVNNGLRSDLHTQKALSRVMGPSHEE